MKESKLFPCYSIPLKEYIASNGVEYELVGLNPRSKKMFWVYIKTPKLEEILKRWSKD